MSADHPYPDPAAGFEKRHYLVPRREIGYLRFICEGYDGLLFIRTIEASTGLIEVAWPPERRDEALALLAALAVETGLHPAAQPPRSAPL